jgi:hypothetical protein
MSLDLSDDEIHVVGQDRPGEIVDSFCISFPPIAQPGAEDHDANDKDCRPGYADQPSDFIWGYCRHRGDGKPAILLIHFDL